MSGHETWGFVPRFRQDDSLDLHRRPGREWRKGTSERGIRGPKNKSGQGKGRAAGRAMHLDCSSWPKFGLQITDEIEIHQQKRNLKAYQQT